MVTKTDSGSPTGRLLGRQQIVSILFAQQILRFHSAPPPGGSLRSPSSFQPRRRAQETPQSSPAGPAGPAGVQSVEQPLRKYRKYRVECAQIQRLQQRPARAHGEVPCVSREDDAVLEGTGVQRRFYCARQCPTTQWPAGRARQTAAFTARLPFCSYSTSGD